MIGGPSEGLPERSLSSGVEIRSPPSGEGSESLAAETGGHHEGAHTRDRAGRREQEALASRQDLLVDYRTEVVVEKVVAGPAPRTAANVGIFWPAGSRDRYSSAAGWWTTKTASGTRRCPASTGARRRACRV